MLNAAGSAMAKLLMQQGLLATAARSMATQVRGGVQHHPHPCSVMPATSAHPHAAASYLERRRTIPRYSSVGMRDSLRGPMHGQVVMTRRSLTHEGNVHACCHLHADATTKVICQGLTGKNGTFHTQQVRISISPDPLRLCGSVLRVGCYCASTMGGLVLVSYLSRLWSWHAARPGLTAA